MRKMSTGQDSTLGEYRRNTIATLGEDSKAVKYLDKHIAESPAGADEEVEADEGQMVNLLMTIHFAATDEQGAHDA